MTIAPKMTMMQAVQLLAAARPEDAIVVATMGAMSLFDRIEAARGGPRPPGRLSSVPLMGGAAGLGLGLALAQPQRQVIVVDGDASLLMELSGLNTVAAQQPANLLHLVLHNGTQFTGLANLRSPHDRFSFAQAARNAGYRLAEVIGGADAFAARLPQLLATEGPRFVELMVEPTAPAAGAGFEQNEMPDLQFARMGQEARALADWLGVAP